MTLLVSQRRSILNGPGSGGGHELRYDAVDQDRRLSIGWRRGGNLFNERGGSLFNKLGCFLRVRYVGHMAGIHFDRLGIGALRHHALLVRIDRSVCGGHHVPGGPRFGDSGLFRSEIRFRPYRNASTDHAPGPSDAKPIPIAAASRFPAVSRP